MKGGYKIIDFKNVSLSGTPVTMTDVLVDLLNNYEKVVLLSHVVLSGSAKDDCFSTVLSDGAGGVKLNCYDGYISINSSGAVTYTVASASGMAGDIAELTEEIGDLDNLETTEKDSLVGAINEVKGHFKKLTKADFTWNDSGRYFDTGTAVIDPSAIRSISVVPHNGIAVLGCYVRNTGSIVVYGVTSTGSFTSDYQFTVYIQYD